MIETWLGRADTGWSMGTPGAIAEFIRTPDEPAASGTHEVVTSRGGIRLDLPTLLRVVAYETPAGPRDHWNHTVALCVPTASSGPARRVITDLGPDIDALRQEDRSGRLIDLGLGLPAVDVCVRVATGDLLARLQAAVGSSFWADPHLAGAIVAAGPHRVFTTPCGRVEVYAPIPPLDGRSPDGPHTHLLPNLLRTGRTHPATAPIPEKYVPVAALYPPREDFAAFLDEFGDAEQRYLKAATWRAVRAGTALPTPSDPPGRAAVAVALRQLARLEPDRAGVIAGLRGEDAADLLDPDGDQHGG